MAVVVREPGTVRRFLIRAGLTKAREAESDWLIGDLEGGPRWRWGVSQAVVAPVGVVVLSFAYGADLSFTLSAVTWMALFSGSLAVAETRSDRVWRRRKQAVLARHGLEEGAGRMAAFSPAGFSALRAAGLVGAAALLALLFR